MTEVHPMCPPPIGCEVIPFPGAAAPCLAGAPPVALADAAPPIAALIPGDSAADVFALINRHRRAVANVETAQRRHAIAKRAGADAERLDEITAQPFADEGDAAEALARFVPSDLVSLLSMLGYIESCRRAGGSAGASFDGWLEPVALSSVGATALAWVEARGGV